MYVRWQRANDRQGGGYYRGGASAYAVLVESTRVDGKPHQQHVAYLGSVDHKPNVNSRAWWWHDMTAKLDRLGNRLPSDQRSKIEAALAKRVPPVTTAEVTAFDLAHQKEIRTKFGECRNCYYSWPSGTDGVPPRPHFEEQKPWANVIAAVRGE
jgi:hypothetical protein